MIPALINELPGEVQLPMVIHIMPCIYEVRSTLCTTIADSLKVLQRLVADPPDADAWIGWVSGAKSKSLVTIPACVIMLGLRTQLNITL